MRHSRLQLMRLGCAVAVAARRGAGLARHVSGAAAAAAPPRAREDEQSAPPHAAETAAERAWMDDWATMVLQTSPRDEVCVPETERRGVAPAKCGGCTCAAAPAACAALCAAPSAAERASLYDPLLPCPLRRVRGFACDVERAAADAAAPPWAQWTTVRRVTSADAMAANAPRPHHALAHAPPVANPPALPHTGAEWRTVLGIKPPLPLPCAPIRGEPPAQRAAALAAATEAAAALHRSHGDSHTASG